MKTTSFLNKQTETLLKAVLVWLHEEAEEESLEVTTDF